MKLINFVLFTLLALFYVSALPTNKLSKRSDIVRRIEKHGIKDRMYNNNMMLFKLFILMY